MSDYRIGDEVYIHGIIDEIRKDTIIIKNEGGYFGTVADEIMPSAQPEQRWIPWDSGRLPNDSGTYIVTAYDGAKERVTFAMYQKRLKRWELAGARAYWRVIAWMPLPEPYRKGGQDEHID